MPRRNIDVGDKLVLTVPVVRVDQQGHWSTVTFSLSTGQRVTVMREAREIVKVLKSPKESGSTNEAARRSGPKVHL